MTFPIECNDLRLHKPKSNFNNLEEVIDDNFIEPLHADVIKIFNELILAKNKTDVIHVVIEHEEFKNRLSQYITENDLSSDQLNFNFISVKNLFENVGWLVTEIFPDVDENFKSHYTFWKINK